jgi:hypothetical protein
MSDLDDVLAGKEPVAQPEPTAETLEEPEKIEQPEGVEPEKAEEPGPKAEEPKAEEPKSEMVPASVVAELRRELRELKQRPQQPPQKAPDYLDNPQAYTQFLQSQAQQLAQNAKLDLSEDIARSTHGDDTVDAAFQALQASGDALAYQKIMQTRNPWDSLVKWHREQEVVREIGGDLNGWAQKKEAEIRQRIEAEMAAKQVTEAASQRAPSMANVSGRGGTQSTGWQGPADLDDLLG